MNDARTVPRRRWLSALGSTIACLAILAASAAAIVVINRTEPTAQQINATRKSAALVETVTVERGTYAPRIAVLGLVEPVQDIVLSPRVAGQVIELSPKFIPGGMVRKGDTLLRIDPADFENALSIRESELQQAEASLEIEEGRQSLARKELDLLGETIDETNRALVLREPQLTSDPGRGCARPGRRCNAPSWTWNARASAPRSMRRFSAAPSTSVLKSPLGMSSASLWASTSTGFKLPSRSAACGGYSFPKRTVRDRRSSCAIRTPGGLMSNARLASRA